MKVLANDGISTSGIDALKQAGFEVLTTTVAQEQLANYINQHKIFIKFACIEAKKTPESAT